MEKLSNPGYVSRLLERHGIRLKKKWGQNFLVDENVLNKIVAAAEVGAGDNVLEVGPGIGALTQKLARSARSVTAVEIDGRLLPVLEETLAGCENVRIVHQDALEFDPAGQNWPEPVKVVANLPYNVATPLFYRWLKEYRESFSLLLCMIQKEVAQRIVARPGGKEYGVLSVLCQYAAKCTIAFDVPRTVFFPRPDVSSAVVKIIPSRYTEYDVGDENFFYKLVDAVFSQRRKTLLNTLHAALPLSKEELADCAAEAGVDTGRRGETLNVAEFAILARVLYNKVGGI